MAKKSKVVTLSRSCLVEGQIFPKGSRLLIESEEGIDIDKENSPVLDQPYSALKRIDDVEGEITEEEEDAAVKAIRRYRRLKALEVGASEESTPEAQALRRMKAKRLSVRKLDGDDKEEDAAVEALRRIRRMRARRLAAGEEEDKEAVAPETLRRMDGDETEEEAKALRRLRARRLRRLDLEVSDGTDNFEGEIANANGDVADTSSVAVQNLRRMRRR